VSAVTLRAVTRDDACLLWEWANDPAVRANAFHPEPIPWETHCAWLDGKLRSPDCRIWIMERAGQPVAQVRYDRLGDTAEIGLSVAAAARGLGLARALLQVSAREACAVLGVRRLLAFVKPDNHASARAFERAGFRQIQPTRRFGQPCLAFELACAEQPGGAASG
jgi:UDP-2,4-diacetamido-2,4,6-trideoxy-beta-L-altropyranose hydrolase